LIEVLFYSVEPRQEDYYIRHPKSLNRPHQFFYQLLYPSFEGLEHYQQ